MHAKYMYIQKDVSIEGSDVCYRQIMGCDALSIYQEWVLNYVTPNWGENLKILFYCHVFIDHVFIGRDTTLNVMAVCNSERLFWNVLAKYPGAHHDNFIFSRSTLYEDLENSRIPGILLGNVGIIHLRRAITDRGEGYIFPTYLPTFFTVSNHSKPTQHIQFFNLFLTLMRERMMKNMRMTELSFDSCN